MANARANRQRDRLRLKVLRGGRTPDIEMLEYRHGREGDQGSPRSRIELTPISGLLDRLVSSLHPTAIWLFGSRARGEAVPSSDWDLLIVVPDGDSEVDDRLAAWRLKKDFNIPSDLFPCIASEFAEDRNTPNTIAYEAAHGGVLIYKR